MENETLRHNAREYADSQVNTIESVSGDTITFTDNWTTTLLAFVSRFVFADYEDVTEQQKRFCFVSDGVNNFIDNTPPYQITFN